MVPHFLKRTAISIQLVKKKIVEQPDVLWAISIKMMNVFEPKKKCSPLTGKLSTDFNPEPFDSCIPRRSEQ
jgi:hypothetical protein